MPRYSAVLTRMRRNGAIQCRRKHGTGVDGAAAGSACLSYQADRAGIRYAGMGHRRRKITACRQAGVLHGRRQRIAQRAFGILAKTGTAANQRHRHGRQENIAAPGQQLPSQAICSVQRSLIA